MKQLSACQGIPPSLYGIAYRFLETDGPMFEEMFHKEISGLRCRSGRGLRINKTARPQPFFAVCWCFICS